MEKQEKKTLNIIHDGAKSLQNSVPKSINIPPPPLKKDSDTGKDKKE